MDKIKTVKSKVNIKVSKNKFDEGQVCLAFKGIEIEDENIKSIMKILFNHKAFKQYLS